MTRVMIAENLIPPDVVLIGPEWPTRALLRAQFVEEGYEVVATIVDLHGLPEPHNVLAELRALIDPDRVLVVTALGTLTGDEIRRLGFHAVSRPASVGEIVAAAEALLPTRSADGPGH